MKKALAVAMALMLLIPLWSCRSDKPTDASSAAGSEPDSYAYAIRVTINPQMTLFLDAQNQVISFRADNEDAAADFSGVELTGKSLNEALDAIVDRAVEKGRLKDGGNIEIAIDTANSPDMDWETVLADSEQEVKTQLEKKQLTAEVVTVVQADTDVSTSAVATDTTAPAETSQILAEETSTSAVTTAATTTKPAETTASTTKTTAGTTAKVPSVEDIYGTYVLLTVKDGNGYRYQITLDRSDSSFAYSLQFGPPLETLIEWGEYEDEEEALAAKDAVWNTIDGKVYGVLAGDDFNLKITALTMDSVTLDDGSTMNFRFDAQKGTLTCTGGSSRCFEEELKGLTLVRQ